MKLAIAFLVETIDAAFRQLSEVMPQLEKALVEVETQKVLIEELRGDVAEAVERVEKYRNKYGDLKS